ncbi:hypothetical protein DFJ74DRAFT_685488 [Hyaloraphidium curvatum]|nr:hypothetical protein DFJ74DRAFT_685488 [Hyaloraphidium curvatum]
MPQVGLHAARVRVRGLTGFAGTRRRAWGRCSPRAPRWRASRARGASAGWCPLSDTLHRRTPHTFRAGASHASFRPRGPGRRAARRPLRILPGPSPSRRVHRASAFPALRRLLSTWNRMPGRPRWSKTRRSARRPGTGTSPCSGPATRPDTHPPGSRGWTCSPRRRTCRWPRPSRTWLPRPTCRPPGPPCSRGTRSPPTLRSTAPPR